MSHYLHSLTRLSAAALSLSALAALGQSAALAQSSYTVTDLGLLSGSVASWSTGIDDAAVTSTGAPLIRVIGQTRDRSGVWYHGFYWDSVTKTSTDIGGAGGTWSNPLDVNNQGEVVGEAPTTASNSYSQAIYWKPSLGAGRLIRLKNTLNNALHSGTATVSSAVSINDAGIIVGTLSNPVWGNGDYNLGTVAVYWQKDATGVYQCTELPGAVTGWGRWARQINANGDIVGSLRTTDGSGSHAVVWKNQNLDPATGLPDPHAPLYGTPVDSVGGSGFFINNAGAVAGFSAEFYGFFWSMPGTTLPEGMVPPGSSYNLVSLHGLNENGQIVGESNFTANGPKTAYVWSGGVMRSLGTLGGVQSFGNALNNAGVVVGDFQLSSLDYHAFRWNSVNGMQDLNSTTLTPTKGAFTVFSGAAGIGSRGNIVGDGLVKRVDHAFLLTPKP